ncbi:MAG TPA: zinc ribbon domain-containing protein [Casimicrobiaceae bacterium]|jgi:putative FmdB family regulatory protein|nr:zinc ribbon domain-containing protein [Casimicrobiaceae bacterium]
MPIYEYRCAACGHKLEALQKFTDAPLSDCPVCGKTSLSKLVSAAGFQLKGSGWYATDFKNSGARPAAKPDASKDGNSKPAEARKSDAGKERESKPAEAKKSDAGKESESKPAEAKSDSQSDSKSATSGEAASRASLPAAATIPTANER